MGFCQWLFKVEEVEVFCLLLKCGLESDVVAVLCIVFDLEILVNIYDFGLIYGFDVDVVSGVVYIWMILIVLGCLVVQIFLVIVVEVVCQVEGVEDVEVELVWELCWLKKMMSEVVWLELGLL